ncbi:hypothetical protein ABTE27_21455, partial [Acinetobacter baumannii]
QTQQQPGELDMTYRSLGFRRQRNRDLQDAVMRERKSCRIPMEKTAVDERLRPVRKAVKIHAEKRGKQAAIGASADQSKRLEHRALFLG